MTWYLKLELTDLNGQVHTVNPQSCVVRVSGVQAGDFSFEVDDSNGALRTWLVAGCVAKFYIDPFSPPKMLRMTGLVETVKLRKSCRGEATLHVEGRELSQIDNLNRIVTETYQNKTVSEIVRDLMEKYMPYSDTVLALSFYEGSGAVAHDESGYGNDGTVYGATWVNGVFATALSFDGVDDYVSVASVPGVSGNQPHSIEAWVKVNSLPAVRAWILLLGNEAVGAHQWLIQSTGATQFGVWSGGQVSLTLTVGQWTHVAVTFDGTTLKGYVNGEFSQSTSAAFDIAGVPLTLAQAHLGENFFNGVIDEVRVYDRALSADEVKQHYLHGYLHRVTAATSVEDIRFNYRTLKEALDTLATLEGCVYYFTPLGNIVFEPKGTVDSGLTLTENNVEAAPELTHSVVPVKNVVYVFGGLNKQVDQVQTGTAGSQSLDAAFYGQRFTPQQSQLSQVSLYIGKAGSPTAPLQGSIRKDNGGVPSEILASFIYDVDYVQSDGWYPIAVSLSLVANTPYWIVVNKVGDAANTWKWFHDAGATGQHAESVDGSAWTLVGNSFQFAFKTHYDVPVIARASDTASQTAYRTRETIIQDNAITSVEVAREIASAKLAELKTVKPQLPTLNVLSTSTPEPNALVTVNMPTMGLNTQYIVREVAFDFKGGEPLQSYMLTLGESLEELAQFLTKLKTDVHRLQVGAQGAEYAPLSLFREHTEAFSLADTMQSATQATGTFVVDTGRVSFSDAG